MESHEVPPAKPVRMTVDLDPEQYRQVQRWLVDQPDVTRAAAVVRVLLGMLLTDPVLSQRVSETLHPQYHDEEPARVLLSDGQFRRLVEWTGQHVRERGHDGPLSQAEMVQGMTEVGIKFDVKPLGREAEGTQRGTD